MKTVKVIFADRSKDYITDVNENSTSESIRDYFVGKYFNLGVYPKEEMHQCKDAIILNDKQELVEKYHTHFKEMRNEMDFDKKRFLNQKLQSFCGTNKIIVLPMRLSNNSVIYVDSIPVAEFVSESLPNGDLKFYSYIEYYGK